MSYFEDISKYSDDLSAQRDNFMSLASRTRERLSAENTRLKLQVAELQAKICRLIDQADEGEEL